MAKELEPTPTENLIGERRVDALERRILALEEHNRRGWIFSEKRWKRSIGILGNALLFPIIIGAIVLIVMGLTSLVGGGT